MHTNSAINLKLLISLLQQMGCYDNDRIALINKAKRHKLSVVLASAYVHESVRIPLEYSNLLDYHRSRQTEYSLLASRLGEIGASCRVVKGIGIGACYPDGWVRDTSDLDIIVSDSETLWRVAKKMLSLGWNAFALSVVSMHDDLQYTIAFRPSQLSASTVPAEVEISTTPFYGNFFTVFPRRLRLFPDNAVLHVVSILEEQFGRGIVARDVLDTLALIGADSEKFFPTLWDMIEEAELWHEWGRIALIAANLFPAASSWLPPNYRVKKRMELKRRMKRGLRSSVSLGRASFLVADWFPDNVLFSNLRYKLSGYARKLIPPRQVQRSGMPLVGIPRDRLASETTVIDEISGHRLLLKTPIGTFELVYGLFHPDSDLLRNAVSLGAGGDWSSDLQRKPDSHELPRGASQSSNTNSS